MNSLSNCDTSVSPRRESGFLATHIPAVTLRLAFAAYVEAGGSSRYSEPLLALLGDRSVSSISQIDFENAARLIGSGKSTATLIRQIYTPLSAALKFSASCGWCCYWRVSRPRYDYRKEATPSRSDIDAARKAAGPSLRRIIEFISSTGISVAETLRLDWSEIDLDRRRFKRLRLIGGSIRSIKLSDDAMECLHQCKTREGRIFLRSDGRAYHGRSIRTALRNACKRSGIAPITTRMLQKFWRERQHMGDDFHE